MQTLTQTQAQTITSAAVRALLAGLVDYAGLFPPAALPMGQAVVNYSAYRDGEEAWALGRFVTPVARFGKLESAFYALPAQPSPWRITALLGADLHADFAAIADLNARHTGRLLVDSVEAKTAVVADIRALAAQLPDGITAWCELDLSRAEAHITALAATGLRAKIRTGGLTHYAFPTAESIADFLLACAQHRVAFKATAGLHHPVRCDHALTYEPDAPRGTMHGFLNVFLAAALAWNGAPRHEIVALLGETTPANFIAEDDTLRWRKHIFTSEQIVTMREQFAISFGSCSFTEPMDDLRKLGLL